MLGNEAIGCGGRDCSVLGDAGDAGDGVCSCGYFLAFLGDAKRRAIVQERPRADPLSAHFNYGAGGGTKKLNHNPWHDGSPALSTPRLKLGAVGWSPTCYESADALNENIIPFALDWAK